MNEPIADRSPHTETVRVTCLDRAGREVACLQAPKGSSLLSVLQSIDFVSGACGGFKGCGACVVELEDGRLVQSCFISVEHDLTVRKF